MEVNEKIQFFRELISCNDNLYSWCYDCSGSLLYTNAPSADFFNTIFLRSKCVERAFEHIQTQEFPMILSINMGLMWALAFQKSTDAQEHEQILIHVLGPVFSSDTSTKDIQRAIKPWESSLPSPDARSMLLSKLQSLPVVSYTNLCRYVRMLHFCLNGEKISFSDITSQKTSSKEEHVNRPMFPKDRHRVWMAEHALMKMITDGNINYKSALNQAISVASDSPYLGTALERSKISQIIFTTLCVRAAINGGLSPETAYSQGDIYIRDVQSCNNLSDIRSISHSMYEDFIQRVHKVQTQANISADIQSCCDYISLHVCEPITLQFLSKRMGYTPYYFARKFKKEMGCSLTDYIKNAKIEHSKLLLISTDASIQEITDELNFCSRSYFSDLFHTIVGCSPSEYRKQNQPK